MMISFGRKRDKRKKKKRNAKSNSKNDQAGTEFILYSVMGFFFYLEDQECNHHRRAMDDPSGAPHHV